MYKCDNPKCRAEFEEPATRKEYHNEIEGDYYELFPCCPCCGCDEFSEIEDEEIADDESEIPSFNYVTVVRYDSLQGFLRNAIFYSPTLEDAQAVVDKYMNGKRTSARTKVCRIFKLISEERNE